MVQKYRQIETNHEGFDINFWADYTGVGREFRVLAARAALDSPVDHAGWMIGHVSEGPAGAFFANSYALQIEKNSGSSRDNRSKACTDTAAAEEFIVESFLDILKNPQTRARFAVLLGEGEGANV